VFPRLKSGATSRKRQLFACANNPQFVEPLSSAIHTMTPEHIEPPSGVVTFLFSDIEGYSTLEARFGAAIQPVLDAHNRLIEAAALACDGYRSRIVGDAFFLVFGKPSDAVRCAVGIQRALGEEKWEVAGADGAPVAIELRVRIGLHAGEARVDARPGERADYFGNAVNTAARVSSATHGGQILVSETARALAQTALSPDIAFHDLGTHRLKGVGGVQLFGVEAPGLGRDFPPPVTLDPHRHNLPVPLSPLVGREGEVAAWGAELREPGTRLLTLCGFGGLGKTRLALQLAESLVESFADGVWWVPLDDARSGPDMVRRLAEVLLRELKPQPTIEEQVWGFHRDRELLIVLDNLEQIPTDEAACVVTGLLHAGARVRLLTTSRAALQMDGERVKELDSLPLGDACTLFTQRAGARRSSFVLSDANRADVEAICNALDGLPLAIELAAAQSAMLSPRQILGRLDEAMRARGTRDATRPARHLALGAAIDWSYQLLGEAARALLPRLAVFEGGFSLDAAEKLAPPDVDAWDALAELRAQSFLRAHTDEATQQDRFSMLEPVRRHAARMLDASGETGLAQELHAQFAFDVLERFVADEATRGEGETLLEIAPEFSNLRAAFAWLERADPARRARFAVSWGRLLHVRGFWEEAREVVAGGTNALATLANAPDDPETTTLKGDLHFATAKMEHDVAGGSGARSNAESALACYGQTRNEDGQTLALNLLGLLALDELRRAPDDEARSALAGQARARFDEALAHCAGARHDLRGKVLHNIGMLLSSTGQPEAARAAYGESLLQRRLAGDARGEAVTLGNLGVLAEEAANLAEAQEFYTQSLRLRRALDEPFGVALMLHNLGEIAAARGQDERALVLFLHAGRMMRALRSPLAEECKRSLEAVRAALSEREGDERAEAVLSGAQHQDWQPLVAGES